MERKTLKELRKAAGITQAQLADELGITQEMLSHIECGIRRPSPEVAEAIAERFDLIIEQMWRMFYKRRTAGRVKGGKSYRVVRRDSEQTG